MACLLEPGTRIAAVAFSEMGGGLDDAELRWCGTGSSVRGVGETRLGLAGVRTDGAVPPLAFCEAVRLDPWKDVVSLQLRSVL